MQRDKHPFELTMRIAHQRLDYTHDNPVIAGKVEKPEDYLYSSARNYFERKGLIDCFIGSAPCLINESGRIDRNGK